MNKLVLMSTISMSCKIPATPAHPPTQLLPCICGGYNKSHMVELSMTFELPEYSMQLYGYIQHVHVSSNPIQEA